ncbi:ABC transporter permease [Beduinella massiliensis]|uniref:ABC transporter permease n=1 Tax=Beduinella massiliensis TaxID=1852363 RepID=UPI0031F8B6DF
MLKKLLKSREMTSIVFIVVLFLGVGIVNPAFLSSRNIMLCFNGGVVYTIMAMGIAFVIMTGEIDVSVGATMGMAAAVSATLIRDGAPWTLAIGAALLIGVAVGLVNGFGVTVIGIPSIIMTLGVNGIVRGLIYVYTGGKWVENLPYEFKALSQASLGSITYFYLSALVAMVVIHLVLTRSRRGRYLAAVGDNIGGATLLGIPVTGTKIASFVLCGVAAAVGGVLYVSRVGFVTPTAGSGYEMKVIAACVLGGISLSGGVGSVIGATVGAAIMASISRVLVFLGFSSDYDDTITGILLITIVVCDALLQHRAAEKARRERLSAKTANAGAKEAAAQ